MELLCNDQDGQQKNRSCGQALQHLCPFLKCFPPQTKEVYVNKRLNEGRTKGESAKIVEIRQSVKDSSHKISAHMVHLHMGWINTCMNGNLHRSFTDSLGRLVDQLILNCSVVNHVIL